MKLDKMPTCPPLGHKVKGFIIKHLHPGGGGGVPGYNRDRGGQRPFAKTFWWFLG